MQGILHNIVKWANWIFIIAIVIVVAAFLTPPIVRDFLGALFSFLVVVFAEVGIAILRFAARTINAIDPTDLFG